MTRSLDMGRCIAAPALLLVTALGCGERGPVTPEPTRRVSGPAVGDVLAVADGIPISVQDVADLHEAGRLPAKQALQVLEAEALLMAEAERRGYGTRPAVVALQRQAMVQAYVEAKVAEQRVTAPEVAAAFESAGERYRSAERRAFVHVLAPLPRDRAPTAAEEQAARALAEEAVAAINTSSENAKKAMRAFRGRALPFAPAVVQTVPGVPADALVKAFSEVLFAAPAIGPVPRAVRTEFGWHAVLVTEIVPARDVSLAQATPELTEELLTRKRGDALTKHMDALRAAHKQQWAPHLQQLLDAPRFDD